MPHETLWFTAPAKGWLQCLPLGNGHIGAMLGGDPACDVIRLNDDTLWSGYPRDYGKPDFAKNIELVRALLLSERRADAEEIVESRLTGRFTQAYLPLGDLIIHAKSGRIDDYTRSLDLASGVHTARYRNDGARVTVESFVSHPDDVLMHRVYSEAQNDYVITFGSRLRDAVTYEHTGFSVEGTAPSDLIIGDVGNFSSEKNRLVYDEPDRATKYSVRLGLTCDGAVMADAEGIHVSKATRLELALCSATSFSKPDQRAAYTAERVARALAKGFCAVKDSHVRDHSKLFRRVSLQLEEPGEDVSCAERLSRMRAGGSTGGDLTLLFQYGRYLLIASSRWGTQAANLQGIWNHDLIPPWWSGYTLNINLQMNYWLADRVHLSDCVAPFAAFVGRLCEAGKKTARVDYGVEGSVAHHQSDIWAHTTPVGLDRERIEQTARYIMWNMALPWLSLQLYDHYQYDRDEAFLRGTLFPVMREAALFLKNTFTRTPEGLCNIPSTSPENMYLDTDGAARAVCRMSAMDIGIAKEFSLAYSEVCRKLDQPQEAAYWCRFSQDVRDYSQMKNGVLREWDADVEQSECGHRHFSMLFGVYPGESLLESPLRDAARKALEQRLLNGGGQTGWSACWAALLLARFSEGDAAYETLDKLMRENIHDNFFGAHPPELFQIDANFGFVIAMCELLIQETGGEVRLLPALPGALKDGVLCGVRVHGGHTLSFGWADGEIVWLEIEPARDDSLVFHGKGMDAFALASSGDGRYAIALCAGVPLRFGCRNDDSR